jgi:DNA-binding winged helix-turn-helix (wHTH) protein
VKLQFAEFVVDSDARQVMRGREPVHCSRKAFDALCLLLEKRPNAVSKEALHERLWPGTHVVDANLSVTMAEVRRVLGDDPQAPRFIRTLHRVGYAFFAETIDLAPPPPVAPRGWLLWNVRVLPLHDGDNLIGRGPGSAVWLDVSGVSRRHARIRMNGGDAVLEDLGSKNGTLVNGHAIAGPTPLHDGDAIQLGPATVQFRTASGASATATVKLGKRRR